MKQKLGYIVTSVVFVYANAYATCTKQEIMKLIDRGFNKKDISAICSLDFKNSKIKTWQRTYGGKDYEQGYSITKTDDGGFMVVGDTTSYGNGRYDIYLIKIDKNGNKIWEKTFGGKYDENSRTIVKTDDGNFIIAANNESYGKGKSFMYLIKVDKNGNKIWEKIYSRGSISGLTKTEDGGFIISGSSRSVENGEPTIVLIKVDKNGNQIWEKIFFGKNYEGVTPIMKIDNGFIMSAAIYSYGGRRDASLIKIDKNGNKIWEKIYSRGSISGLTKTEDGNFLLAGWIVRNGNSDVWIMKINKDGNILWQKNYGGNGVEGGAAVIKIESGFMVVGDTSSYGNGSHDVYLIKIDKNGNKIWEKTYGGSDLDFPSQIIQTDDGGFIIVGWTGSYGNGRQDVYLIKIDKEGNTKKYRGIYRQEEKQEQIILKIN